MAGENRPASIQVSRGVKIALTAYRQSIATFLSIAVKAYKKYVKRCERCGGESTDRGRPKVGPSMQGNNLELWRSDFPKTYIAHSSANLFNLHASLLPSCSGILISVCNTGTGSSFPSITLSNQNRNSTHEHEVRISLSFAYPSTSSSLFTSTAVHRPYSS